MMSIHTYTHALAPPFPPSSAPTPSPLLPLPQASPCGATPCLPPTAPTAAFPPRQRTVRVMVMVLKLGLHRSPTSLPLVCSSGAVLRSRSAVPRCLVGCTCNVKSVLPGPPRAGPRQPQAGILACNGSASGTMTAFAAQMDSMAMSLCVCSRL